MPRARITAVIASAILVVAACGPAGPAPSPTGQIARATTAATTASGALSGAWDGDLGTDRVGVSLDGCVTIGNACGEVEYLAPGRGDTVLCASELTLTVRDGDRFSFSERYVYHAWNCLPTTFAMTRNSEGALAVEQFVEPTVAFAHGTLRPRTATPDPTPYVGASIPGLGRTTSSTLLDGVTTQYAAAGSGSLWFPLDDLGAVARVDPATGAVTAIVAAGDPGALEGLKTDPHGVAAGDAGIWVARAAARAVSRIDPATNTVAETVPLPVIPYVLALDGNTLWVTSFENDQVVRVDLATRTVVSQIPVNKPTGIAVGLGGVWVVRHRDDVLVRIDPVTNKVTAEISLGVRGPNDLCGMCVENVIVSDGSVWTSNNEGRSVGRIDPETNKVTTIPFPLRVWAVAAGGGRIWASQFEGGPDDSFLNSSNWTVASIDPATSQPTAARFPGALSVTWGGDALWLVVPGRRGDTLVRVEPEAP